ncbi:MAG TPA: PQQ-binding-like beta-propeller repeat protein [Vicinamibacterales bacterium]|jgi:outer membrane protein assembly factor BamB
MAATRHIVTTLLLSFSATLLGAQQPAAPATSAADAWKQFRGSPTLTGLSSSSVPAALKVLWTYDLGDIIESSAAIAGGVVYVGGGNGDLVALDLQSGKLKWKYTTGNLIGESSPAVGTDAVYVGDLGGLMHAVRIGDGKGLWTFKTASEIKSSPVIADGAVLFGSYDGNLYAVDEKTGRLRWKFTTNGMVHATPAVQNGLVFIAGCDAMLRAIRIADGKEAYRVESGAYTGASPLIDGTRAYYGTFNNEVLGVDLQRRRILWRYSDPDRRFPFYSSAALAGSRVILGGRDKSVHAIDMKTGKAAWTFATKARVDSSPVIAGGRVYIGSSDGKLYVLDVDSGKKLFEFDAGSGLTTSPAIAAGRVVIGSQDGRLYVLG